MSTSDKELQDAFKRSQQVQKQNDGMSEKANARIRERVLAYNKAIESDSGIKRVFAAMAANIRAYLASSTLRFTAVAIRGYGTMSIDFLQENIANELAELSKKTKTGGLDIVAKHFLLDEKSAFMYKVKAYMDVKQELSSSKVKRKLTMMKKKQADTYQKNIDYDTARFKAKTRRR